MVFASYAGCNGTLAVTYFTIAAIGSGFMAASLHLNQLDLSPNNAGMITALYNGLGAITSIVAPNLIGFLTPNVSTPTATVEAFI